MLVGRHPYAPVGDRPPQVRVSCRSGLLGEGGHKSVSTFQLMSRGHRCNFHLYGFGLGWPSVSPLLDEDTDASFATEVQRIGVKISF